MGEVNEKALVGSNPSDNEWVVDISIPETIKISMVDATVLADYKVWSGITAFLSNAVVGFGVAALTGSQEMALFLWVITGVFGALLIASAIMAIVKSNVMNKNQKTIRMGTSKK